MLYDSIRLGRLLKDATRMMPAKGSGSLSAGWTVAVSGAPKAKRSVTADVTAVPRLSPVITMREGDMFSGSDVRKLSNVTLSVMTPSSVGVPVEMPYPR